MKIELCDEMMILEMRDDIKSMKPNRFLRRLERDWEDFTIASRSYNITVFMYKRKTNEIEISSDLLSYSATTISKTDLIEYVKTRF